MTRKLTCSDVRKEKYVTEEAREKFGYRDVSASGTHIF